MVYFIVVSGLTFNAKILKGKLYDIEAKTKKELQAAEKNSIEKFIGKRKNVKCLWVSIYAHQSTKHINYRNPKDSTQYIFTSLRK